MQTTWKPHERHGRLTAQSGLPDTVFAFPNQRKEPLTDAQHVRNAVARFDQVIDVSDADRDLAFANIETAAKYYNVDLSETSWHELGVHPQHDRKEAAAKSVATKRDARRTARRCRESRCDQARERGTEKEEGKKAAATRKREREKRGQHRTV